MPGNHQQQEAGHHQEMQETINRRKPGEPFAALLGGDLGLPEFLGVMQV